MQTTGQGECATQEKDDSETWQTYFVIYASLFHRLLGIPNPFGIFRAVFLATVPPQPETCNYG